MTGVCSPISASSSSVSGDAGLVRDREQVEDAVRRAAGRGDARHRVQQRAPVEEAAGRHALAHELHGEQGRCLRGSALRLVVVGRNQAVADPGEAEAVERDRHRVGREVAGARAEPRAGDVLQLVELRARQQPALLGADRLPDVLDRHRRAVVAAGAHRPAVEDDGRLVDAVRAPSARRDGLVAADEADERRRSRGRAPSARSSRRSPRARRATRACRACPATGCPTTAIVLNSSATPPAAVIASPARRARSSRWLRLHGIVCVQVEAMPMIGPSRRAGSMPIARKCARAARSPARPRGAAAKRVRPGGRVYGGRSSNSLLRTKRQVDEPERRVYACCNSAAAWSDLGLGSRAAHDQRGDPRCSHRRRAVRRRRSRIARSVHVRRRTHTRTRSRRAHGSYDELIADAGARRGLHRAARCAAPRLDDARAGGRQARARREAVYASPGGRGRGARRGGAHAASCSRRGTCGVTRRKLRLLGELLPRVGETQSRASVLLRDPAARRTTCASIPRARWRSIARPRLLLHAARHASCSAEPGRVYGEARLGRGDVDERFAGHAAVRRRDGDVPVRLHARARESRSR